MWHDALASCLPAFCIVALAVTIGVCKTDQDQTCAELAKRDTEAAKQYLAQRQLDAQNDNLRTRQGLDRASQLESEMDTLCERYQDKYHSCYKQYNEIGLADLDQVCIGWAERRVKLVLDLAAALVRHLDPPAPKPEAFWTLRPTAGIISAVLTTSGPPLTMSGTPRTSDGASHYIAPGSQVLGAGASITTSHPPLTTNGALSVVGTSTLGVVHPKPAPPLQATAAKVY